MARVHVEPIAEVTLRYETDERATANFGLAEGFEFNVALRAMHVDVQVDKHSVPISTFAAMCNRGNEGLDFLHRFVPELTALTWDVTHEAPTRPSVYGKVMLRMRAEFRLQSPNGAWLYDDAIRAVALICRLLQLCVVVPNDCECFCDPVSGCNTVRVKWETEEKPPY